QRYLTPMFEHPQPFWFFGPIFLLRILPWLPLLMTSLLGASQSFRSETRMNSPALFIASWSLFTPLFFSLSQSKLPGYILPAIPPAVLLLARSFVRQTGQNAKGIRLALACVGIVFPFLIGIVYAKRNSIFDLVLSFDQTPQRGFLLGLAASLVGGGLVVGFAIYRKWNS